MESVARDVADVFHIAHLNMAKRLINFGDCIWLRLQVQKEEEEPVMADQFDGAFFSQSIW